MELESQQNVGLIHVGKLNELVISDGNLSTCWLRYTWRSLPSLEKIKELEDLRVRSQLEGYFHAILLACLLLFAMRPFKIAGSFFRRWFFSVDAVLPINPCLRHCVVLWWVASTFVATAWLKGWCGSRRGRLLWWNDDFESKITNMGQLISFFLKKNGRCCSCDLF